MNVEDLVKGLQFIFIEIFKSATAMKENALGKKFFFIFAYESG